MRQELQRTESEKEQHALQIAELTEHSQELQANLNKAQLSLQAKHTEIHDLGAKYSMTQKEWSRSQADQSKAFDRLQTMEERGRLQDSSIDQMSKLIQAQEKQIRELKENKGKLEF